MKQWRRTAAGLMACAMLMGCMTALPGVPENSWIMASAEEYTEGTYELLMYRNYGDYIEITGCDASATAVNIPEEIEGVKVTGIKYAAFMDCSALETVEIPDSVTAIGENAFYNTALWNSQTGGVIYADDWVVGREQNLANWTETDVVLKEGTVGIADYAFTGINVKSPITSVEIPDSVKYIGGGAFDRCREITSITIPEGITEIKSNTFYLCSSLESIVLPKTITSIGKEAFSQCGYSAVGDEEYWIIDDVYFGGTEEAWNELWNTDDFMILEPNRPIRDGNIHYNYTPAPTIIPADLDGNSEINASDAAILLTAAAASGTGADTGLTEAQIKAADLNADGAFDAKDASLILMYAAYVGSGGELSITEYLATL